MDNALILFFHRELAPIHISIMLQRESNLLVFVLFTEALGLVDLD
jgi:hypothetical protein